MKYVCTNPDCEKFGVEEFYSKETYHMKNGRLIGENIECPYCHKEREEVINDVPLSEKNVNMTFFNSMTTEQRQEVLKKRSHEHFKKEIKERKEGLLHQAMTEMKDLQAGKL